MVYSLSPPRLVPVGFYFPTGTRVLLIIKQLTLPVGK